MLDDLKRQLWGRCGLQGGAVAPWGQLWGQHWPAGCCARPPPGAKELVHELLFLQGNQSGRGVWRLMRGTCDNNAALEIYQTLQSSCRFQPPRSLLGYRVADSSQGRWTQHVARTRPGPRPAASTPSSGRRRAMGGIPPPRVRGSTALGPALLACQPSPQTVSLCGTQVPAKARCSQPPVTHPRVPENQKDQTGHPHAPE